MFVQDRQFRLSSVYRLHQSFGQSVCSGLSDSGSYIAYTYTRYQIPIFTCEPHFRSLNMYRNVTGRHRIQAEKVISHHAMRIGD
jgi:hypothetical protein